MVKILLGIVVIVLLTSLGYCQDSQELIGEVARIYTGSDPKGDNLIAGFSLIALMGGFLFASIGFVAFMYGKGNAEFRPMLIGIVLMGYPYFIKNAIPLYLVGIVLVIILFVWRE